MVIIREEEMVSIVSIGKVKLCFKINKKVVFYSER